VNIATVNATDNSGKPSATSLGNFADWTWIIVQVVTPSSTLYLSDDQMNLQSQQTTNGQLPGIQLIAPGAFTATTPPPAYQGWWRGQLWAISNLNGTVCQCVAFNSPAQSVAQRLFSGDYGL